MTIGILGAQLINFGTSNIKPWGWRLSLALGAVPALTLFIGSIMLPDTPNSLVQRGQAEKAVKVLRRVRGVEDVHAEFDDITNAVAQSNAIKVNPFRTILKARYRPHLVISLLIPIFQQVWLVGWLVGERVCFLFVFLCVLFLFVCFSREPGVKTARFLTPAQEHTHTQSAARHLLAQATTRAPKKRHTPRPAPRPLDTNNRNDTDLPPPPPPPAHRD